MLAPGVQRLAADDGPGVDAKSRLQELVQQTSVDVPEYDVIAVDGPDHARTFTVVVRWRGRELGKGRGATKKAAQQAAAADALRRWPASETSVQSDDAT